MRVLINASNLKQGGGIQVADSICRYLSLYKYHCFDIILSSAFQGLKEFLDKADNITVTVYDFRNSFSSVVFQRDAFLDRFVAQRKIDVVLTVFGPARWKPSVPHLCGFARGQILPMETPYFFHISLKDRLRNAIVKRSFNKCADYYWTENPSVSELLSIVFPKKQIYTVSNNYNQVFDEKDRWVYYTLPPFNGVTLLTVTNSYPHKNLSISIQIAYLLKKHHPDFSFRFVFTIDESDFPIIGDEIKSCFLFIGRVDISMCPSLYQQADIMFQPSLIECFTATYPEAMRMGVPIITTDLAFAHGLCNDAALYYSPLSADDASKQIYRLTKDNVLRGELIEAGRRQLASFMKPEQRVERLVQIIESIA